MNKQIIIKIVCMKILINLFLFWNINLQPLTYIPYFWMSYFYLLRLILKIANTIGYFAKIRFIFLLTFEEIQILTFTETCLTYMTCMHIIKISNFWTKCLHENQEQDVTSGSSLFLHFSYWDKHFTRKK